MTTAILWIIASFMEIATLRFAYLAMTRVFIFSTYNDAKHL